MNQELIGKTIKEIRKKENLSQQKFAEKYGVTYQAVSKWENGKNIPDITIIKEICKDYNLDLNDFLDTKIKKKFNNKFKYIIIGIIILTIFTLILSFYITQRQSNNNFEFKTLSSIVLILIYMEVLLIMIQSHQYTYLISYIVEKKIQQNTKK